MSSSQRILVINPNTNAQITDNIRRCAQAMVCASTHVVVSNPPAGPLSIETLADREAAIPQVLALIERSLAERYDAYVLACFDDIALPEARAMTSVPVVGTCEAGIAAARSVAERFSVVTTVHAAVPTIHGLLQRYGAQDICTVHAAGIGVAEAATAGDAAAKRIEAALKTAIEQDGAKAILLGSGGLIGRAPSLQRQLGIPVIDGVLAAVVSAEGMARLRLQT